MRPYWAALLLAVLPIFFAVSVPAQLDQPRDPGKEQDDPAMPMAPDDTVTVAPLPPPRDDSQPPEEDLVPNPLREPPSAQSGRRPPGPAQPQGQAQKGGWVQMGTATLQVLDKVNARGATLVVKAGETGRFGSLEIAVRGCFVRPADRPPDATAMLIIQDRRSETPAFTGWMVKSAPYMSMLAHPIYDVRVMGCAA